MRWDPIFASSSAAASPPAKKGKYLQVIENHCLFPSECPVGLQMVPATKIFSYLSDIFCIRILLFQMPSTSDEWKAIAHDFRTNFKFWNCIGAIDGKHIVITNPTHAGSIYYNYMGVFSVVHLAVVNTNKEFLMVDVGINGRISDGGMLFHSKFGELFQEEKLNLPPPSPLPNCSENFPFVFVGAFLFEKMKKAIWLLVGKLWIDVLLWSWKEQSIETFPRKSKT